MPRQENENKHRAADIEGLLYTKPTSRCQHTTKHKANGLYIIVYHTWLAGCSQRAACGAIKSPRTNCGSISETGELPSRKLTGIIKSGTYCVHGTNEQWCWWWWHHVPSAYSPAEVSFCLFDWMVPECDLHLHMVPLLGLAGGFAGGKQMDVVDQNLLVFGLVHELIARCVTLPQDIRYILQLASNVVLRLFLGYFHFLNLQ